MTAPVLARTDRYGRRYYLWDGHADLPSVTTILASLTKKGLDGWQARRATGWAVTHRERLAELTAAQARTEILAAPDRVRDTAATLGTAVHAAVNARLTGRPAPVLEPKLARRVARFLAGFEQFQAEHRPEWLESEQTVFSLAHGYAGTLDAVALLGGRMVLLDIKTGQRVYPEAALQLAAYARGEFIGRPDGTKRPLPLVDAAAVLHLRPGRYQLRQVAIGQETFAAFLAAAAAFRWQTELAGKCVGRPIRPPHPLGTTYLIHFVHPDTGAYWPYSDPAGRKASGHYIGFTVRDDVEERLAEHRAGRGNPLVRAAVRAGRALVCPRTWPATNRDWERRLHNRGHHVRLCPLCDPIGAMRRAVVPILDPPLPLPGLEPGLGVGW